VPATKRQVTKRLGRPPATDGEVTRQRLIAVARRHFASDGFEKATSKAIAGDAGLTSGTIYHYFGSKQALYAAVAEDSWRTLIEPVEDLLASDAPAQAKLVAVIQHSLELRRADPHRSAFAAAGPLEASRHPELVPAVRTFSQRLRELYRALAEEGVARGEMNPAVSAAEVAEMLMAVSNGFASFATTAPRAADEAAVKTFVLLLEGQLFAR
jgi:AcrR family transcriptional regulator